MTSQFEYQLTGTGWAEVTISNSAKTLNFEFSYLSDPLSDLLNSLLSLHRKETFSEKIGFPQEPGEYSLILTLRNDNVLDIEVYECDEWEAISKAYGTIQQRERVYFDTDNLLSFSKIIYSSIKRLFENHGAKNYEDQWCLYSFPEKSFLELGEILNVN